MKLEVLGAGCPKCSATKKLIQGVVRDLRSDAEVVEVFDIDEIIGRGVMATPAVFVDGELKSTGRVPSKEDVKGWLSGREVNTKTEEPCACLYYLQEQAKMVKKAPSLRKLTCKGCGTEFSSNVEKDYCFACEKKGR